MQVFPGPRPCFILCDCMPSASLPFFCPHFQSVGHRISYVFSTVLCVVAAVCCLLFVAKFGSLYPLSFPFQQLST